MGYYQTFSPLQHKRKKKRSGYARLQSYKDLVQALIQALNQGWCLAELSIISRHTVVCHVAQEAQGTHKQ